MQNDNLFQLIQSLTKAEKRFFSLYISRQQSSESARYIRLFDVLSRMKGYNEDEIFKKERTIIRSQLANLKAHLYNELLVALRLLHSSKSIDIQIREQIDFARILYNRGLPIQSLRMLDRAKGMARANSHFNLLLEIVQFEQMIESRHITRSIKGRAEELHKESDEVLEEVSEVARLSSLALSMYGLYLQKGHASNERESEEIEKFFKERLGEINRNQTNFYGKAYLHQAYCWYYYIRLDFPNYYRHAWKWVQLFEGHPKAKYEDPFLYLKGMHNLVNAIFSTGKHEKLEEEMVKLQELYEEAGSFNENLEIQSFVYLYTARINEYFLKGDFSEGLKIVGEIEEKLEKYGKYIDVHRVMIFYYKIACLYFGSGDNERCILYLNRIINLKVGHLRSDLQCFARLLHLIAHYELGSTDLLDHLIKSVYRYLSKMENLDEVQNELLRFLRRSLSTRQRDLTRSFVELKERLEKISQSKYSRRSYQYLDIVGWLESKINGEEVEDVIKRRFVRKVGGRG